MARTTIFLLFVAVTIAILSPACSGRNALFSPDQLSPGQALHHKAYAFIMQTDCNLVLYDGDRPIWASQTYGQGSGCRAVMQSDGNLVVYDNRDRPLWASNTAGSIGSYVCVLQADRNVVIYGRGTVVWSTGTNIPGTKRVELTQTFDPAKQLKIAPAVITNTTAGEDVLEMVVG